MQLGGHLEPSSGEPSRMKGKDRSGGKGLGPDHGDDGELGYGGGLKIEGRVPEGACSRDPLPVSLESGCWSGSEDEGPCLIWQPALLGPSSFVFPNSGPSLTPGSPHLTLMGAPPGLWGCLFLCGDC